MITNALFSLQWMKKRSLDELLRIVFSAPWPAWKFLEESKGGTSCPVPQVNTLFKNQENVQSSSLCVDLEGVETSNHGYKVHKLGEASQ